MFSQRIGESRINILKSEGNPSSIDTLPNKVRIGFKSFEKSGKSSYKRYTYYYFDNTDTCQQVIIVEPQSEANGWIKLFNDECVKMSEYKWKDYSRGLLVQILIKENAVYVDFKKL
jgi:hypothetical protein